MKSFPWYKVTETCIRSEDAEAVSDYLLSGGLFTDIEVPRMYLKKLFDHDSLIMFDSALQAELARGSPHSIETLVDTLRNMILSQIPRRARLIKMMERTTKMREVRTTIKRLERIRTRKGSSGKARRDCSLMDY